MIELIFAAAITLWNQPNDLLEAAAFVLALGMVVCNMYERMLAWPLAIASSLLYAVLFWQSKLIGTAVLQLFFVVLAIWGWSQWLLGKHADGGSLRVSRLSASARIQLLALCGCLIVPCGYLLARFTESLTPWWEAVPTVLSVFGTVLLARKYIENWLVWLLVNLLSLGLFVYKGLWLTVLLYSLFGALSVWGYRTWQRKL